MSCLLLKEMFVQDVLCFLWENMMGVYKKGGKIAPCITPMQILLEHTCPAAIMMFLLNLIVHEMMY